MKFLQKLDQIQSANNSLLCIGLDSDIQKIPSHLSRTVIPQYSFNTSIIDATHDLVCAYKPNSAFYEARGAQGIKELKMTCDYIHKKFPHIIIILDAKRADVGNTNTGYASFAFDYLGADAITLNPYLGGEAIQPFLNRADKASIILCRTSNPGAVEFQDVLIDGIPLYIHIAKRVVASWNKNGNCMLVVGATFPEELKRIRDIVHDMVFLVPGVGVQGGDIEKTVKAGLNSKGTGMIINSSRTIIFSSNDADFDTKARETALRLRDAINAVRQRGSRL